MIELKLNKQIWDETNKRADALPIFKNSHRALAANQVGCLGEVIVEWWLKFEEIDFTPELTETTHDYRLAFGTTFDVKTKDRTVKPRPDYDCSIPLYNHEHQQPDYYVFVSLQRNKSNPSESSARYHTAYILGGLNQHQLGIHGKEWKKGEVDPSNGTKFWTACKNVKVNQLITCDDIIEEWQALT